MSFGNTAVEDSASFGMNVPAIAAGIGVAIIGVVRMKDVLITGVDVRVRLDRAVAVAATVSVLGFAAGGAYCITAGNFRTGVRVP